MAILWTPPTEDLEFFDLIESVTLQKVAPDGTVTEHTGIRALGEPKVPEAATDAGGMKVTPGLNDWRIKASSLPAGVRPDRGDRVVSVSLYNAGTWQITAVEAELYGVTWMCRNTVKLEG